MPPSPRVLLASYKDTDTAGEMPFLFVRAGCVVDAYGSDQSWLLKSRYRNAWYTPPARDPAAFARGLADLVEAKSYDWVVLIDDDALRAVHDHLDWERSRKILALTNPAHVGLAGSKHVLSVLCKTYGLTTPSFAVHAKGDRIEKTASGMPFPLLIKVDRSGGGHGVHLCRDMNELQTKFSSLSEQSRDGLTLQEYIPGNNIAVEALYHDGALLTYASCVVVQNIDTEFSVSCVRDYMAMPELTPELERIGTALGFDGFCSYTFMRPTGTKKYYLVEADLRPHAWFALSRFCGVDFSEAIRQRFSGATGVRMQTSGAKVRIRHFYRDINRTIRQKDWRNLLAWLVNLEGRWRFIPTHDRTLLVTTLRRIVLVQAYRSPLLVKIGGSFKRGMRALASMLNMRDSLLHVLAYFMRERARISAALLLALLQTLILLPIPFIIKHVFDAALPQGDVALLLYSTVASAGLFIASTGMMLVNRYITLGISKSIIASVRMRLVEGSLFLGQSFYATEDLDLAHSRIVHDTERLDKVVNAVLTQILPSLLIIASLAFVLLAMNPILFGVMALVLPALYLAGRVIGRRVRASIREFHDAYAVFSKGVSFVLKFNELIALSSAERQELARQQDGIRGLEHSSRRMAWLGAVYGAIQGNILILGSVIVVMIGGLQIIQGSITLGSMLSFLVALNLLSSNFRILVSTMPVLIEGHESVRALIPFLESASESAPGVAAGCAYPIEFIDVSFGYGSSFRLDNVSFTIAEGTVTGIFGASGAGKSTIIRLLLGLYRPEKGLIRIGGQELSDLDLQAYRDSIGVLTQDPLLFPGTILENLTYGLGDVPQERIESVCRLCKIHDFISGLEEGYGSVIGNRGVNISGGQRQRLAIARALLREPKLLILDEPDNNLDEELVSDIIAAIRERGITLILISHNPSLRKFVDTSLSIQDGIVLSQTSGSVPAMVSSS